MRDFSKSKTQIDCVSPNACQRFPGALWALRCDSLNLQIQSHGFDEKLLILGTGFTANQNGAFTFASLRLRVSAQSLCREKTTGPTNSQMDSVDWL